MSSKSRLLQLTVLSDYSPESSEAESRMLSVTQSAGITIEWPEDLRCPGYWSYEPSSGTLLKNYERSTKITRRGTKKAVRFVLFRVFSWIVSFFPTKPFLFSATCYRLRVIEHALTTRDTTKSVVQTRCQIAAPLTAA